ncbi:GNAT family N-acetyltransferase [Streptacidiphilus fuscans]|uniref:GNAT family N-acetyltransferase n=1 Tax=Streptacidiphilus fuscans TaxID=2789292 RepID=A0A931FER7_9ACTN|nr:GNAT family protein [Streptacidiphilus fuscans]MBF9068961.1 GNAT family N-acetyltransferase [Streptacidiphilus fuscans]MBF9073415.1 GNAT family N-acetyltransferase [Streptacidiphilus fuscans]
MTSIWIGERVRLRGIEPEDGGELMRIAQDEEGLGDLIGPPRSAEHFRGRAREEAATSPDAERFPLAIEAVDGGALVGVIGVHQADPRAGWFEYGISVAAAHRGKGYAGEAAVLLLRFMFGERRYHRCEARVFAHNEASLALQRRLGFVEEGRMRDRVFQGGRHGDLVVLGLLAHEFAERWPR